MKQSCIPLFKEIKIAFAKALATSSIILAGIMLTGPVNAQQQDRPVSTCQAVANLDRETDYALGNLQNGGWPGHVFKAGTETLPVVKAAAGEGAEVAINPNQVRITYVAHSTFRIETPEGLKIATDFSGFAGANVVPDVVTMNHAHGTHFTVAPDPRIPHVLRGWGTEGEPAKHYLQVADTLIRNVTTNIDNDWAGFERDGNSIFIFEVAGLCIGHLGHLHHLLTENHYASIGRLDVLMVPVDGGYTLNTQDMTKIAKRLQASVILPMHWFGLSTLDRFLRGASSAFPIDQTKKNALTLSLNTLPVQPTVTVLLPESSYGLFDGD